MSSSVQLDSGNTRIDSPRWIRPLYRSQSSGRWFFGSHWPNSSRKENTRSLARALSSSRRAPPNRAVNPCCSTASSSTGVWIRLRDPLGSSRTVPDAIASGTEATTSSTPSSATRLSRNSSTSGKFSPVSTCITGNGMRAGGEGLAGQLQHHDGVLAAGEEQHGPLGLGGHLAQDVDGLGLQRLQLAEPVVGSRHALGSRKTSAGRGTGRGTQRSPALPMT